RQDDRGHGVTYLHNARHPQSTGRPGMGHAHTVSAATRLRRNLSPARTGRISPESPGRRTDQEPIQRTRSRTSRPKPSGAPSGTTRDTPRAAAASATADRRASGPTARVCVPSGSAATASPASVTALTTVQAPNSPAGTAPTATATATDPYQSAVASTPRRRAT